MVRACLAAAVAIGALFAAPVVSGTESASRVIDRTAVCQMPGEGFPDSTRFMTVTAARRHERTGFPPFISIANGPSFELRAQIRTRAGGRKTTGSIALSRTQCTPANFRVRFSTTGLRDRSPKTFGSSYRCNVPTEVTIRVRATFRRPTGFSRDPLAPSVVRARGQIATGYVIVTAVRDRKPLVYASVSDASGDARLFVARRGCAPHR
jgi:hypothetical protein